MLLPEFWANMEKQQQMKQNLTGRGVVQWELSPIAGEGENPKSQQLSTPGKAQNMSLQSLQSESVFNNWKGP